MQLTSTFKIKTQPTSEPVTILELQSQLNQDLVDDGGKYTRILTAAREMFESHSGVSLMPTVWQCFVDRLEECDFKLMRGPVSAISSVGYVDASGVSQTWSGSLYQTDIKRTPARIAPVLGQAWPVVRSNTFNTVTIEFTAGFASATLVPNKAKQAILMLAAYWVENPSMMGQVGSQIDMAYWSLVDAVHWEVFDE